MEVKNLLQDYKDKQNFINKITFEYKRILLL